MKGISSALKRTIDICLFPIVFLSALVFKFLRKKGVNNFPFSKQALLNVGVFPIVDHYYEPLFNPKHLIKPLSENRKLPGINWNIDRQIELLNQFNFQSEFEKIANHFVNDTEFSFDNNSFGSGDAEYWYNIIRLKKPKKIIEIGSGNSTKMARLALEMNKKEDSTFQCSHICIEPYEMPWLEKIGAEIIREKVETIGYEFFQKLEENDILFIDSSHMIRPQGDVLFEYLELLPTLKKGVIVHIHDIFSPKDYPNEWVVNQTRLWNEQYLLEAFLSHNYEWEIIGGLNYLKHNYFSLLKEKCPRLTNEREPGSFYLARKA